ncbi:MAG: hypothetical protein GY854_34925 [Deltaproteobacteria bacterium]|nr:hypothetical protein [Deltaproteobacteria bacterium]
MEIKDLVTYPEGKSLEFKRDTSSLKPILKTLVAFANTAGGTLVIGLEDSGELRGVSNAKMEEERIANAVAESIAPALFPDIEIATIEDVDLLVVHVARWPGPYFLKADGATRGVYVRLGSTNRRASPEAIEELKRELRHRAFDQLPCIGAELEDLDIESAKRVFSVKGRDVDEAKLESLGVLVRYGDTLIPSNGGVILFGLDTTRRSSFPDARVRCARFQGTGKSRFLDQLDIEVSVLDAIEEIVRFVRRNTRLAAKIEGLRRQDIPEYPQIALREGLVNAVAHTDYSLNGMNIRVAIFDDRLEIENPGTFPFGLTVNDLKAGVSRIRNPVIARVLHELELMEYWGSGYKRMSEDCQEGGYPLPEWVELSSVVRTVFTAHPDVALQAAGSSRHQVGTKSALSRHQVQLLEFTREERSVPEMMELLDWRDRTKFRTKFIRPLLDTGYLAMTIPEKPQSSKQRYVTTEKGLRLLDQDAK